MALYRAFVTVGGLTLASRVLGFVRDYRWYLIGASVLLTLLSTLADRKGGGELGALRHLSEDLGGDEQAEPGGEVKPD